MEGQGVSVEASYSQLIEEMVKLLGLDKKMQENCGELETTLIMAGDAKGLHLNTAL